ncbi:MAG: gliding motility-associated C-terminal domain-containing protein [Flavobacteriales bacterium]|nr:gliding motility-associated C-terminal domain-containing protein [Flavobacteriales bacterium]
MKDSVNSLFQQRFQGHETPVDPAVWQGIQQQMAVAAPANDAVNDLFRDRFAQHEVPVDPSAWSNISSQLGHPAAGAGVAGSAWGWVAAGVAAAVVTTGVLLWQRDSVAPAPTTVAVTKELVVPQPPLEERTLAVPREVEVRTRPLVISIPAERVPSVTAPTRSRDLSASSVPSSGTPSEAEQDTPASEAVPSGNGTGEVLVSDIITDLTEQVIQGPVTAQPEPGAANKAAANGKREPSAVSDNQSNTDLPVYELTEPLPELFMPNTFTPNGDLVNDTYTVGMDGFQNVMVRIYSLKTNALVFSTNNGEPWTGANCEDGMYMVAVEASTLDGRTVSEGKVVWLNRNRLN